MVTSSCAVGTVTRTTAASVGPLSQPSLRKPATLTPSGAFGGRVTRTPGKPAASGSFLVDGVCTMQNTPVSSRIRCAVTFSSVTGLAAAASGIDALSRCGRRLDDGNTVFCMNGG